MSVSGRHALPEHWTELSVARTQKERCAREIDAIKISCAATHNKTRVAECQECYPKVLDVLQTRYCDNDGREWFTTRKAFVHELGALFADSKDGKLDLQVIEARIESEKEAWYRWVLRMYPEFLTVANSGVDQEELRAMLDDPDKTREQLIEKVWEGVGKPADWSENLDTFVQKFEVAKEDPADLKKLYLSQFFADGVSGNIPENGQKYLDEYPEMNGEVLMEIIDRIARDERASKSSQPQRDGHNRRLDELRRAKAAFEQNRAQAKARRQEAQARAAPDDSYWLPACEVCGKALDSKNVLSCVRCQATFAIRGSHKKVVYCSEECLQRGYDDHAELHVCCEREDCVGDEDEDMDGVDTSVACNICTDEKAPSVWCSEQCAYVNISRHRAERHGRFEPIDDIWAFASLFKEVMAKALEDANPGVKFHAIH